jgi:hypothetical protein
MHILLRHYKANDLEAMDIIDIGSLEKTEYIVR